jgi:hypothetical protein
LNREKINFMKQRGRNKLSVVTGSAISAVDRPEPLADLTPEQRIEWVLVVNSLPADWFPGETLATLAQYCKHVVAAKHVAELITEAEAQKALDVKAYGDLLRMQIAESKMIVTLATKMRITQQATYDKSKTKPKQTVENPLWAED